MLKTTRINAIRTMLVRNSEVYVSDLAKKYSVSRRTIRRDLEHLAFLNVAEIFYGGARLKTINREIAFKEIGITKIMNEFTFLKDDIRPANAAFDIGVYIMGSFNVDIVSLTENFPKEGQTVHALSTRFLPGGKGANQAAAASKVIDNVHLTVKLGADSFADIARDYFANCTINTLTFLESKTSATGNAVIMIDSQTGENMIAINLGANKTITDEELDAELPLIESSRVFLTQLENNIDITQKAIEYASYTSTITILNPAPYSAEIKKFIHLIDIITPNETEAEDLTGIKINNLEDAYLAAREIYAMGVKIVIITLGGNGVFLYDGKDAFHCPAFFAAVEDTSGAGDSFNGSLAAMLSKGESIKYSIRYASAFASFTVELSGAASMPSHNLVVDRLLLQKNIDLIHYKTK